MLIVEWSKVDHEGCRKVCLADDVAARIDAVCDALGTAERAEVNHRPLRVEEGMMVVDLFAAAADHEGRKVRLADDVAARIDAVRDALGTAERAEVDDRTAAVDDRALPEACIRGDTGHLAAGIDRMGDPERIGGRCAERAELGRRIRHRADRSSDRERGHEQGCAHGQPHDQDERHVWAVPRPFDR